ncbi:MAG: 50S ribosomal protein L21 [Nannocystaceae bacterium]
MGTPKVAGAKVTGVITAQGKHPKVIVHEVQRRRKNYRRKRGHRQLYTEIKIEAISA